MIWNHTTKTLNLKIGSENISIQNLAMAGNEGFSGGGGYQPFMQNIGAGVTSYPWGRYMSRYAGL